VSELLPKGKHRARAREWVIGEAGTGTKQVGVDFDLLDRVGESQPWYGYFTEKALESTVKALRAMGWQGSDVSELDNHGGGLDANEVVLVVEHEQVVDEDGTGTVDDEGQPIMRARVRWVNSAGGVAMKNLLTGNELKGFGASMRERILALDPTSAAKRAAASTQTRRPASPSQARRTTSPVQRPEPPPPDDSDIPF